MNRTFDFEDLFILDLANNHQGSREHALSVIRAAGEVVRANEVRAALKFQYRQLDTFIHPSHREDSQNKHVKRFLSTRLSNDDFKVMADEVRRCGMITMATPFDEESVELIQEHDLDVLKIGSCSATDWPLIEAIAECNKPVVCSTGGLTWKQIDDLVSFFDHRRVHFALLHCVAIYPTPSEHLQLNQIELLRKRFPDKVIGFSTHESPDAFAPVHIAVAKGARILERHVGLETDTIKLNKYSSTPEQLERWIKAAKEARIICGAEKRQPAVQEELDSLHSLMRGIYLRRPVKKGQVLTRENTYFAMPPDNGQLTSGSFRAGMVAHANLDANASIGETDVKAPSLYDMEVLFTSIHTIKAMLNEAQVSLPSTFETEFSHHYGIGRFAEIGATFITCVNRDYCKKIVIQLPGQKHPPHYHKCKEETFMVLHGQLDLEIEGRRYTLHPGDTQLIQQGVWHEFWTDTGVLFEEISSRDGVNDSFYEDKNINQMQRPDRKTRVNQWGRYQL